MRVEFLATFIDQKFLECLSPKSISLCKSIAGSDWGPRSQPNRRAIGIAGPTLMSSHPFRPQARRSSTRITSLFQRLGWLPRVCNQFTTPINKVDAALEISGQSSSHHAKIRRDRRGSGLRWLAESLSCHASRRDPPSCRQQLGASLNPAWTAGMAPDKAHRVPSRNRCAAPPAVR
jgi:hypothetical protein